MFIHRFDFVRCVVGALAACVLAGCAAGPQTTRLTIGDMNYTVSQIANQLKTSDFLENRGPDSPRIVVVIDKVQNLTSDVISPSEQWMMVARIQGGLDSTPLAKLKNITFQIPPERYATLRQAGLEADPKAYEPPTHVMSAVFRSATRTVTDPKEGFVGRRQDYYYLEYAITRIDSRQIVWSNAVEFKREAVGLTID